MGLTEEERHRIYEEEKARIEAREQIGKEKRDEEERTRQATPASIPAALISAGIVIGLWYFVSLLVPRYDEMNPGFFSGFLLPFHLAQEYPWILLIVGLLLAAILLLNRRRKRGHF